MKETVVKIEDLDKYLSFKLVTDNKDFKKISSIIKNGIPVYITNVDAFASYYYDIYDTYKIEKYLVSRKKTSRIINRFIYRNEDK